MQLNNRLIKCVGCVCMLLALQGTLYAHVPVADEVSQLLRQTRELMETNPDSALKLNKIAYEAAQLSEIDSLIFRTNAAFAEIYFQTGNHYLAIDYFIRLLPSLETVALDDRTQRQWLNLFVIYDKLANSYFALGMYDFAEQYFSQNLELLGESQKSVPGLFDEFDQISVLFNLGSISMARDDLDASFKTYMEVDQINKVLNDSIITMYLLNNLGIYHKRVGNDSLSHEHFQEALALAIEVQDHELMAKIYNNLGNHYAKLRNPGQAITYYQNAMEHGKLAADWSSVMKAANDLSSLYADRHNYDEAYKLKNYAAEINDSIFHVDKMDEYTRLTLQYELDKELRISQIEQQALWQKQRSQKILFVLLSIVLFLMVLGASLIIVNSRRLVKIGKIRQAYLQLEAEQHRSEKVKVSEELEQRNRHLTERAMAMVQKNEFIARIAQELYYLSKELPHESSSKLIRLVNEMQNDKDEQFWKEFETRFVDVHSEFYKALNEKFPDLTPGEKKLAAFLRLNMTTKDIAAITTQSPDSIKVARSRLRKKLGLNSSDNLIGFLESINISLID